MGIPGLKVETEALMTFSGGVAQDFGEKIKPAVDAFKDLPMKVGLSGLPSAATLGNWTISLLGATSNFFTDLGEASEAVTTGAMSVAAIYQSDDGTASEQMEQINAVFAPGANEPSLGKDRAKAEQEAREKVEKTDAEIAEQARKTTLEKGATPTAATSPAGCAPPDPTTARGAQQLVDQHRQDDRADKDRGRHSEMDEYDVPAGTPAGLNVPGVKEPTPPQPGPSPTPPRTTTTASAGARPAAPGVPGGRGGRQSGAPAAPGPPAASRNGGTRPASPGLGGRTAGKGPQAPSTSGRGAGSPALGGRTGRPNAPGTPGSMLRPRAPATSSAPPRPAVPRSLSGRNGAPATPTGGPSGTPVVGGPKGVPALDGRTTPSTAARQGNVEAARSALRKSLAGRPAAAPAQTGPARQPQRTTERLRSQAAARAARPPATHRRERNEEQDAELPLVGGTELFEAQSSGDGLLAAGAPQGPVTRSGPTTGAGRR